MLAHRGPDDQGFYLGKEAALGHRRLAVLDIARGQEPMHNEDRSLWLVFNGEIYNFQELKALLLKKGHEFYTLGDAEVVLHLYEEFGEKCLEQLRGMFAFGVWDESQKRLFLARDRLGIKPLYYAFLQGKIVFSSELKALLLSDLVSRELDFAALDEYLSFRYTPAPGTIFRDIHKLPPAHYLTYEAHNPQEDRINIGCYWDLPYTPGPRRSKTYYAQRLLEELKEAVRLRLISEVPLGAFLSGGVDSSAIVALMSEAGDAAVKTFSVGFEDEAFDESPFALKVAEQFCTQHQTLVVKGEAPPLAKVAWHLDEPLADAASIPTFQMAELAKKFVTVVLSGEGADELFAGYSQYKVMRALDNLRAPWSTSAGLILSHLFPQDGYVGRGLAFLGFLPDPSEAFFRLMAVFTEEEKEDLLTDGVYKEIKAGPRAVLEARRRLQAEPGSWMEKIFRRDLKTWLPDDLLLKGDKMTMAWGLEQRLPYLDHKLVEFASKLPVDLKVRIFGEKYILREALKGRLAKEILSRPKHGFSVPWQDWLEKELAPFCERLMSEEYLAEQGLFKYSFLKKFFTRRRALSNLYRRRQFWTLFSFQLWSDIFVKGEGKWPEFM
jgi:asparagine synthase (glutamine-hydrolysing)